MAMAEWWEAATSAIAANTGMTPAVFFTGVAVAAALCVAVSGLLARPAQASARRPEAAAEEAAFEPLPPPVQLGEVTEEDLRAYDGSDPKKPLLMAIKGQIYDVTQSRMFYGPGGPYALFAGRDASRALAKMSFEASDLTGDISGLGPFEVEALQEWEHKFKSKYVTVGKIKKTVPVTEGDTARSAVTAERDIDASSIESNNVPEPKETGLTNQGSEMAETTETPDVDVNTSSNEDEEEKAKELPVSEVTNTSSQADTLVDVNTSSHEDEEEKAKELPVSEVTNTSSQADTLVDVNTSSHEHEEEEKAKELPVSKVTNTSSQADTLVDVNTSSHEDEEEKAKELPVSEVTNTSSQADTLEKPEETTNEAVKNKTSTEDAVEPKEPPEVVDGKDTSKPEDATEKPNEAADAVDLKNTISHEDVAQPKDGQNADEKDVISSHQNDNKKPKEPFDEEVNNA